jgi:hypothetical protein
VRVPALPSLLKQLNASSRPVRAFEYDPSTERLRIEFADAAPVAPKTIEAKPTVQPKPVDFVPGTMIPNDDSPLHPFDLVISPPTIGEGN